MIIISIGDGYDCTNDYMKDYAMVLPLRDGLPHCLPFIVYFYNIV